MNHPETFKVTEENGPRPAGPPDECFYCHTPLGDQHKAECVCRKKTIMMQYTIEIPIVVPQYWGKENVEFFTNDSSSCGSNHVTEILQAFAGLWNTGQCLCGRITGKYLREATVQDEDDFSIEDIGLEGELTHRLDYTMTLAEFLSLRNG